MTHKNEPHGADWPPGTIIEMYGETYRVRRNRGDSGEVEYLDGELASNNFFWIYQGDQARLVELPASQQP